MNGVDPQAWLTDILARITAHPVHRLNELLPWDWTPASAFSARAARPRTSTRFITQVAKDLGEDEDWLWDIANEMEIEDGVIWVYGENPGLLKR
ncbi:hypothetical protein GGD66_002368 [Bradyrhizobium sp. CIR48]|nr:hypothetical protein [Bradyrhizobium sp. CIR48]